MKHRKKPEILASNNGHLMDQVRRLLDRSFELMEKLIAFQQQPAATYIGSAMFHSQGGRARAKNARRDEKGRFL